MRAFMASMGAGGAPRTSGRSSGGWSGGLVTPLLTLFAGETGRDPAAVPSFPPGVVTLDDPLTDLPFVLAGSSFSSPMTDTARDGGLDDAGFLNAPSDATLGGGSFITDPAREGAADGGFFAMFGAALANALAALILVTALLSLARGFFFGASPASLGAALGVGLGSFFGSLERPPGVNALAAFTPPTAFLNRASPPSFGLGASPSPSAAGASAGGASSDMCTREGLG
mmetsp:Transcript_9761/g.42540  ORF Transcript_9761/g.42540 Transcript_9761/m.42540 type:complete len:228 (-) Transcript_9761:31-714(-)